MDPDVTSEDLDKYGCTLTRPYMIAAKLAFAAIPNKKKGHLNCMQRQAQKGQAALIFSQFSAQKLLQKDVLGEK